MNNFVVYLSEIKWLNKAGLKAAIKSVTYNSGAASLRFNPELHGWVNILGLLWAKAFLCMHIKTTHCLVLRRDFKIQNELD